MYNSSQVYHQSLIVAPANLANCDGRTLHDSSFSVSTFHQTESIGRTGQFTAGNGRGVERTGDDSFSSKSSKSWSCSTSNASDRQDIATRAKININFLWERLARWRKSADSALTPFVFIACYVTT